MAAATLAGKADTAAKSATDAKAEIWKAAKANAIELQARAKNFSVQAKFTENVKEQADANAKRASPEQKAAADAQVVKTTREAEAAAR